jgi:hypothetical protein
MQKYFFFLALLLCSPSSFAGSDFPEGYSAAPEQSEGWSAVPKGRPFASLPPDPLDIKTALRKNSQQELEASVGSFKSLAGWKGDFHGAPMIFHTGIEGMGLFEMRQQGGKFPLQSSDGFIGAYAEAIQNLEMLQFRYTHISAHLSDGLYGTRTAFVYSREYAALRYAHQFSFARAYVGYQFLAHTIPTLGKHSGEIGFYSVLPQHWGNLHPFFGADLRVRNADEGTTYNLSTGIAILSSEGASPLRIAATYLHGHDIRGQFYMEKLSKFSAGIEWEM